MNRAREQPVAVLAATLPGSANAFYTPIIRELKSRGWDVHIVTSDGPEVPRLRERADTVHVISMVRTISLLADLRALFAWVRLLRTLRPALVLGGTPKAALLALVAARLTRVPRRAYFLLGLRLEGTTGTLYRILAAMEWLTSWSSHVVLAVSPSLAARYESLHLAAGRPIDVPHHGSTHGVDSGHFTPVQRDVSFIRDLGMDPDVPIVLFIGRLTADKGPDALFGALDLLKLKRVDSQLLVLGDQDEEDSTRYQQRLQAGNTPVRSVDAVVDVRPYIAAADFLVLPTRREGMPNVVLEAAAMGLPCVTTTVTGARDSVVDGETGLLVPPDDPRSLATAMRRLLQDPELSHRMGKAARARVVSLFDPDDVAKAVVDIAINQRVKMPELSQMMTDLDLPAQGKEPNAPRVTVLLPSIRIDPWLRRALESILNDGYPSTEVILLLDGMKEMPTEAWLRDPRVTCVPMGSRVGIARALNRGLELATSEFIARMDGDDISLPGRLRAQVDFLLANGDVAVVGCQAVRIDEHEVPIGPLAVLTDRTAIRRQLLTRNALAHPTIMFRKSAVLDVGGYSTSALTLEDYDLYLRLAAKHEIANLPGIYLNYRVHSSQISRGFNPFSADKSALVRQRRELARTMRVPLPLQLTRDVLWYGAQITRYLHLRR